MQWNDRNDCIMRKLRVGLGSMSFHLSHLSCRPFSPTRNHNKDSTLSKLPDWVTHRYSFTFLVHAKNFSLSYTNQTREWLWSNMEKDSFLCRDFRVWNQLKGSEQRMGWELGSQSWESKRKKGIFKLKIIGFPLSSLISEFYWLRGVMNGSKSSWLTIG